MIGSVGIILRLKAEAGPAGHRLAVLAGSALKEIAGVELDSGKRRKNGQRTPGNGVAGESRFSEAAVPVADSVVMVITAGKSELLVFVVYTLADCMQRGKVERRSGDVEKFTRGDGILIDGREPVGADLEKLPSIEPESKPPRLK